MTSAEARLAWRNYMYVRAAPVSANHGTYQSLPTPRTSQLRAEEVSVTYSHPVGCDLIHETLYGYDQGVFGGLLTNPLFQSTFDNPNPTIQGQITSTYYLGCVFGAVVSRFVGDFLGRRQAIMLGCTLLTVGGAIQATSFGLPQLFVGRIVAGLGTGLNTTAIPMWHVESAKGLHRGKLVTLELVLNIFGIVIAHFLNYGLSFETQSAVSWRFPVAFQCFFAILTFSLVLVLPESPRWLILRDRQEEAAAVVARYHTLPASDVHVRAIVEGIAESVAQEVADSKGSSWKEMFHNGRQQNFRRICLGAGTAFMQQLAGCNIVATYLPVALENSIGLGHHLSLILAGCNEISLMFWGAFSILLIDRWGRKPLLLTSSLGMAISLFLIAIALSYGFENSGIMATVAIFLYNVFFGLGLLAIPWLYPAEINSQSMRNTGASISTTTNWLFVYVVVLVTPLGISNLGYGYYLMFGLFTLTFLPFIWYFYVETAGLTLEQIDQVFELRYNTENAISYSQARREVIASPSLMPRSSKNGLAAEKENIKRRD
ncbi:uncharacterized protein LTR77_001048 [Saxophila tyrrhenica]|uniref:Major facilitator superfamily (MFS) profile domain-containing protein n=1 Tax=Saxophila tyrrhenica TaxID=1690608 RepID=A0AAV9PKD2_9PEZI|nr:hypothetical protein LTR77_001048 [Saxophila tyrrhenica]